MNRTLLAAVAAGRRHLEVMKRAIDLHTRRPDLYALTAQGFEERMDRATLAAEVATIGLEAEAARSAQRVSEAFAVREAVHEVAAEDEPPRKRIIGGHQPSWQPRPHWMP